MRVLIADRSLPARHTRPAPFLGVDGELVHSAFLTSCGWHFAGLVSGLPCGSAARVAERDTSVRELADLAMADVPLHIDRSHLATTLLLGLGWVQDKPEGVWVTTSPSGTERLPPQPAITRAWLREDAARDQWPARMREEGRLPLLVLDGSDCWRSVAVLAPPGLRFLSEAAMLAWVRRSPGMRRAKAIDYFDQDSQLRHSEGP